MNILLAAALLMRPSLAKGETHTIKAECIYATASNPRDMAWHGYCAHEIDGRVGLEKAHLKNLNFWNNGLGAVLIGNKSYWVKHDGTVWEVYTIEGRHDVLSEGGRAMKSKAAATCVLALILCACSGEQRELEVLSPTELLEKETPLWYPNSGSENSVKRMLSPQTVTILSDSYGKDYHVYRVRDGSGNKGYVIDGPQVREIPVSAP